MTDKEQQRSDRLSVVAEREFAPDSLVGSFFLSDASRGWQGCVVAEVSSGVYLVETLEWLAGGSHDQQLVRLDEMTDWTFYDTAEWMRNAYEGGVQRQWERQRKESGEK